MTIVSRFLILFITYYLFINTALAGSWTSNGSINSTLNNVTIDNGDSKLRIGVFADNFDDGNIVGWTTTGGTQSVISGAFRQTIASDALMTARPTTFTYTGKAMVLVDQNITVDDGWNTDVGWGASTWDDTTGAQAGYSAGFVQWRLWVNDFSRGQSTNARTLNVWSKVDIKKLVGGGYSYNSSYNTVTMSTTTYTATSEVYPYLNGGWGAGITQYWDNFRVIPITASNNPITLGSLTTWYNSGTGNEVYLLYVNATGQTNANYSVFYRTNGTGSWTAIGTANSTINQSISLSTRYQNTDVKVEFYGNYTLTPNLTQITFFDQPSELQNYIPPSPINLANTTGNFWVNHTWQAGAGNITNSYNVSQNGTWNNTSSLLFKNISVGAHNWSNISVYAYNSSGTGSLNSTPISMNTQVPNNAISISNVSSSYSITEGQILYIDANHADSDGDVGTFADNATQWNVNSGTGIVSWQTVDGDQGVYNWQINVTDGYGSVSTSAFSVTVGDSTPSVISSLANTTGNFWINWTWNAGTNDDDYDVWINNSDLGADTSSLYYNGTYSAHASRIISVRGHNHTLNTYSGWVNQTTNISNNPITITNTSNKTVSETETVYVDYDYTDLDSDSGVFSCNRTDLFTDFSTSLGTGNWTTNSSSAGTYYIDFGVIDGYGSSSNYTMQIIVTESTLPSSFANVSVYANKWQPILVNNSMTMAQYGSIAGAFAVSAWNVSTLRWDTHIIGRQSKASWPLTKGQGIEAWFLIDKTVNFSLNTSYSWNLTTGWNLVGIE